MVFNDKTSDLSKEIDLTDFRKVDFYKGNTKDIYGYQYENIKNKDVLIQVFTNGDVMSVVSPFLESSMFLNIGFLNEKEHGDLWESNTSELFSNIISYTNEKKPEWNFRDLLLEGSFKYEIWSDKVLEDDEGELLALFNLLKATLHKQFTVH